MLAFLRVGAERVILLPGGPRLQRRVQNGPQERARFRTHWVVSAPRRADEIHLVQIVVSPETITPVPKDALGPSTVLRLLEVGCVAIVRHRDC